MLSQAGCHFDQGRMRLQKGGLRKAPFARISRNPAPHAYCSESLSNGSVGNANAIDSKLPNDNFLTTS